MELSLDSLVVASKNQVTAELAEEVVILSLADGEYYGLNAVGAKVWAAIQQPTTAGEVRDTLLREFPDVDPDECTRDLLSLLEELLDASLIELPPAPGG